MKAVEVGDAKGFGDMAMARGVGRVVRVEKSGLGGRRGWFSDLTREGPLALSPSLEAAHGSPLQVPWRRCRRK